MLYVHQCLPRDQDQSSSAPQGGGEGERVSALKQYHYYTAAGLQPYVASAVQGQGLAFEGCAVVVGAKFNRLLALSTHHTHRSEPQGAAKGCTCFMDLCAVMSRALHLTCHMPHGDKKGARLCGCCPTRYMLWVHWQWCRHVQPCQVSDPPPMTSLYFCNKGGHISNRLATLNSGEEVRLPLVGQHQASPMTGA